MVLTKVSLFVNKKSGPWCTGYGIVDSLNDVKKVIGKHFLHQAINDSDLSLDFLADPFIIINEKGTYVFVEHVPENKGKISCFFTEDIHNKPFRFLGMVLDEARHVSYAQVFNHNNRYYLLPETVRMKKVLLYATDNESFPFGWKQSHTLIEEPVKDPTFYEMDGRCYIFGQQNERLYYWVSNSLTDNYTKNTRPLLAGTESRPGGRIFSYDNKLLIPIQNNRYGYGTGLSLYVVQFDKDNNIKLKPYLPLFLSPQKNIDAFSHGMHHFDMVQLKDGTYFCVFDGNITYSKKKSFQLKQFIKYSLLNILNIKFK